MKKTNLFVCLLLLSPLLFSQAQLKPTDDPEVLHLAAMNNLELQAVEWDKIAAKTENLNKKDLYARVALSYRTWKALRQERYIADKNEQAVRYEVFLSHQWNHNNLVGEATALYGKGAPKLPEEVKPKAKPKVEPSPTPIPDKSYTTESGFEVKFRLEE